MVDKAIILTPAAALVPDRLLAPTAKAAERVLEFFTAQIKTTTPVAPISSRPSASRSGARITASAS
jgi:hypothetical protein